MMLMGKWLTDLIRLKNKLIQEGEETEGAAADDDAMEVDEGGSSSSTKPSSSLLLPNEMPTQQDEEDLDEELQAIRLQIRQVGR